MRLTDHLDLLDLSLRPLRARGFDQQVAARILFRTYPRQDVIHHLRTRYCGCGSEIGALLFLPALFVLSTNAFAYYHLWVCTPTMTEFFARHSFPAEIPYRRASLLRLEPDGCTKLPEHVKVDVNGPLDTSIEQLNAAIFIVDDARSEQDFSTLLDRAVGSPASILAIVPEAMSHRTSDVIRPQVSFPLTWDPPLLLYYRGQPAETT
jgi:hypothetical protein